LLKHIAAMGNEVIVYKRDLGYHRLVLYHCCICYSLRVTVIGGHTSFETWLSTRRLVDVIIGDVARRPPLQFSVLERVHLTDIVPWTDPIHIYI
jgi:hypothetical protein